MLYKNCMVSVMNHQGYGNLKICKENDEQIEYYYVPEKELFKSGKLKKSTLAAIEKEDVNYFLSHKIKREIICK